MVTAWREPKKFFLSLEKQKAINTLVRHLIDVDKDVTDHEDTINPLQLFVEKHQFFNQNYQ